MPFAGLRNLCAQWFPPRPSYTEKHVPSQQGRVFIVTGGNAGVGFELCKILYGTGATIYMASRSKDRAEKAIQSITESTPAPKMPGQLKFLSFDLNDLDSVKAAAVTFAQQEPKLDVLWNNAGTGANMVDAGAKTKQGFEAMVGMHCVATLLFTQLVLPQLRAAVATSTTPGSVRVVWTSSFLAETASPTNGVNFGALENGVSDRTQNYAVSKVGTWMIAREMARRHGNGKDDIVSVVQNPGNLNAGSYSGTPPVAMFFIRPLLHHSVFGAYTELFAGLSPTISYEQNGSYVIPWGRIRSDKDCPRKDIIKAMTPTEDGGMGHDTKFWEWCEQQWRPFDSVVKP